jgi:hypothetical protein
MARSSETDQTRGLLVQMAQVWFRLAEEARRSGDTPTPPVNGVKQPSD